MADLDRSTRDLRKTVYLSESVDQVANDVCCLIDACGDEATFAHRLKGLLHKHIGDAWDAGASREADLKTALSTARALIDGLKRKEKELRRQLHQALRRISDDR